MLNPEVVLNTQIFDPDQKSEPIRNGFGRGLLAAGETNSNVVALTADLAESTRVANFAEKFPDRFFECGVAEQGMVTVAAGLAAGGKVPFVASYAVFSPGRNWEQVRTTVCYNQANVKIAGHHAGLSVGPDGATHQALEDVALMRVLPNMTVIVPCDSVEAEKATLAAANIWGPVYLRLAREATPVMTTPGTPFVPGRAEVFWASPKPKVTILAAGPILFEALQAAKDLEADGTGAVVLNIHTIKPLDKKNIIAWAKKSGAVVTVEEHQIAGGLGGAASELLAAELPLPMEFVGVPDQFGQSGIPAELARAYSLISENIVSAAKRAIRRAK